MVDKQTNKLTNSQTNQTLPLLHMRARGNKVHSYCTLRGYTVLPSMHQQRWRTGSKGGVLDQPQLCVVSIHSPLEGLGTCSIKKCLESHTQGICTHTKTRGSGGRHILSQKIFEIWSISNRMWQAMGSGKGAHFRQELIFQLKFATPLNFVHMLLQNFDICYNSS